MQCSADVYFETLAGCLSAKAYTDTHEHTDMHTDAVLFAAVSYFKFNCLDQSVYFLLEYLNILVHIVAHTQEHTHTHRSMR